MTPNIAVAYTQLEALTSQPRGLGRNLRRSFVRPDPIDKLEEDRSQEH